MRRSTSFTHHPPLVVMVIGEEASVFVMFLSLGEAISL
jgi:hypothetical protein